GEATNLGPFKYAGWDTHGPHANPIFTLSAFPAFTDSIDYRFKHYIFSGATGDFFTENDTVIQYQRFRNYYAFDDGSAEGGYYVLGSGGRMVQKIQVHVADTLRAMRIYFDPVGNYNSTYKFRMHVWSDNSGIPGAIIHTDSATTNTVKHYSVEARNASPEYVFQKPILLNPGTYYIGMQQFVATGITVGFDKNINHSDRLWYDSGNGWTQSAIYGSVMMRPVFGDKIPPPVGIREFGVSRKNLFTVYPNPASDDLHIDLKSDESAYYTISNSIGQTVKSGQLNNGLTTLQCNGLSNGVYFLTVKQNDQAAQCQKIIIQH
ncbi:MAG: hypothetical protein K0S12_2501, partial [Bacteroidetes bacterium]|nr:hypothetical protein [Bacteroidota bacterium]